MAGVAATQNVMANIALCQTMWTAGLTGGVPIETAFVGIGRVLDFKFPEVTQSNGGTETIVRQEAERRPRARQAAKDNAATAGNEATTRGQRRPRTGSKREQILALISASPAGLSRGEIIEGLGLAGDKTAEMSVSNALTTLTKKNQARRDRGKYLAVADGAGQYTHSTESQAA